MTHITINLVSVDVYGKRKNGEHGEKPSYLYFFTNIFAAFQKKIFFWNFIQFFASTFHHIFHFQKTFDLSSFFVFNKHFWQFSSESRNLKDLKVHTFWYVSEYFFDISFYPFSFAYLILVFQFDLSIIRGLLDFRLSLAQRGAWTLKYLFLKTRRRH